MGRLARVLAFARNDLVVLLRQPRLLLVLVLAPFLLLFVFGLGFDRELPALATMVVGGDGELVDRVDAYIRETEPHSLDYLGTTDDEDAALDELESGEIDLVVVLPDDAMRTVEQGERAVIRIHQRGLDPVTRDQISVAATVAVHEINDEILRRVVEDAQQQTRGIQDELATGGLGFGDRAEEYVTSLRSGAELLRTLSDEDSSARLDETATALADLEEAVEQLSRAEPGLIVRPFTQEVTTITPVEFTLDRFYAPGLVALMLQHLAITFAALSLVRERDHGTLEILRVAPATLQDRLLGKGLAFLVTGAVVAAALTALIIPVFGIPPPASWPAFTAVLALVLVASVGYGYLVAAMSKSHSQAVQYSMLFFLASIFFAGLFMPLEQILFPVVILSWLLPATHAFKGLQDLMLLQRPLDTSVLLYLALMVVVVLPIAAILLRRQEEP